MVRDGAGSVHRLSMRSEVEMVPELDSLGYIEVIRQIPPSESLAPWTFMDVRVTSKLVRAMVRAREARERYAQEVLQVGMFNNKGGQ